MSTDYPTKEQLYSLKCCDYLIYPDRFVCLLREIWNHNLGSIVCTGDNLELHTGGWLGNEEIIEALKDTTFWGLCWQKSERGGHHNFRLTPYTHND